MALDYQAEQYIAALQAPNRLELVDGAPDPLFSRKAGQVCVYVNNASLYFLAGDDDDAGDADGAGWRDSATPINVKVAVEYFDKGTETIRIGYTLDGASETLATIVTKTNTKTWKKATLKINSVLLGTDYYGIDDNETVGGGGDHYNADFRIFSSGDLYLGSLALTNRTTKAAIRFPAYEYLNQTSIVPPGGLPGTGDEFDDELLAGWTVSTTKFAADSGNFVLDSSVPSLALGVASAFGTGVGIWQGKDSGVYKWRVGDPSGNKAQWDGAAFSVTGSIDATGGTISGTLTVSGTLQNSAGNPRWQLNATGFKQYDSGGTQRSQLLNDGSGWLGSSSVFSWTTAGVVSLNGSAVVGNSLDAGKVSFYAPTLSGLTFTNNSPSAGYVAWSSFALTYQGVSYTIASGNSNSKYIYWKKSVSTTVLQTSATIPACAPDMFIACVNFSGTAYPSNFAPFIYADYISVANLAAINADMGNITAGTITGATIRTASSGARTEMNASNLFGLGFGGVGGYNGTTTQWYAKNSDGKFYFAGGKATIASNALELVADGGAYLSFVASLGGTQMAAATSFTSALPSNGSVFRISAYGKDSTYDDAYVYLSGYSFANSYANEWQVFSSDSSITGGWVRYLTSNSATPVFQVSGSGNGFITGALAVGGTTNNGILDVTGKVFIGASSNAHAAANSITIAQGGNNNKAFSVKRTSVAHGMTALTETDTYFSVSPFQTTNGGAAVEGYSASTVGLYLHGISTTADTARSTSAVGAVVADAAKKSGTGKSSMGANGNLFVVRNDASTQFLVDAEGDIHMNATSNINAWDDYDDVKLLEAFRMKTSKVNFKKTFVRDVEKYARVLNDTGVLTLNADGRHFVSMKGLFGLTIDALRQLAWKVERYERAFAQLGVNVNQLAA